MNFSNKVQALAATEVSGVSGEPAGEEVISNETLELIEKSEERWARSGSAVVWIKDSQVAIEFHQCDMYTEKYYIFYSDEKILEIAERGKTINRVLEK